MEASEASAALKAQCCYSTVKYQFFKAGKSFTHSLKHLSCHKTAGEIKHKILAYNQITSGFQIF